MILSSTTSTTTDTLKKKRITRNRFEERIYSQLVGAKILFTYESEKIPYVLARHYIPDFILDTPLGKVYVETKGYLRPEDKAKLRAVKKLHPEMDLRIVFYAYKEAYIKWANKHGIIWAIDKVPETWYKGLI